MMDDPVKKIKVLNVIGGARRGGTERIMHDILARLDKGRFELYVWSLGVEWLTEMKKLYEQTGISTDVIGHDFSHGARGLTRKLIPVLREGKFDIVHTHHMASNFWVRLAAIMAGVPVVMTYDHNFPNETWKQRLMWRLLSLRTNKNVCVSNTLAKYRIETYPQTRVKICVVYDGIDLGRFGPVSAEERGQLRKKYKLPVESTVIACVGRLVKMKRFDMLIDAASRLKDLNGIEYIIAGEGAEEDNLKNKVIEKGLEGMFHFTGWVDDIQEIFQLTDILVMPSGEPEGFGLTSAEAMACGIPIVASNTETNREIITEDCAILVDGEQEIADALTKLINDPGLSNRLGRAGRERATSLFNVELTARRLQELYLESYHGN